MTCIVSSIFFTVLVACAPTLSQANAFLGRTAEQVPSDQMSIDVQHALLGELQGVLGNEHKSFTGRRLAKIEDALRPIFIALPKNAHGNLDHAAASYALHRVFVQRHGWSVKGLQSETKALAAWNTSSPTGLFQAGRADDHDVVSEAFEERIAETGLGLHELAVLAATLEHFVHTEAMARLRLAYGAHDMKADDVVSISEADDIMDSYMVVYILGFMLKNATAATPTEIKSLRKVVNDVYPNWNATQEFLREVKESVAPKRDYFYFSDVASVIEEAGERYGTWQDKECRELKDQLMAVEDIGPGGAGRVRLVDFYKMAVEEGKSQFSESVNFLRQQGALDESDPANPRVIITNYISSPSNCVASSSYFSVCCADECEALFKQLERTIAGPDATPDVIIQVISSIASHTVPKDRELSPWLLQRLDDIAKHHGGRVPLHGRLFTQWMHFAYPRECSYPHVSGVMEGQRPEDVFSLESLESMENAFNEQQMREHIETFSNQTEYKVSTGAHDESDMWTMEEELVVWRAPTSTRSTLANFSILRSFAFAGLIFSVISILKRTAGSAAKEAGFGASQKYYV